MSAPQIGDVISTAEELDLLPPGAAIAHEAGVFERVGAIALWHGYGFPLLSSRQVLDALGPMPLVYLPGQPPRPERVVKAEALREVAGSLDKYSVADVNLLTSTVVLSLRSRANRIERGESS